MSERKKLRNENELSTMIKLYESLKKVQKGDFSNNNNILNLLNLLTSKSDEISALALKSLSELFRINMSFNIISAEELDLFFNVFYDLLDKSASGTKIANFQPTNLNFFISLKVFQHLKNKELIINFYQLLHKKSTIWEEQIVRIIFVLLQEEKNHDLLDEDVYLSMLEHNELVIVLLKNKRFVEFLNKASEEKYVKIFLANLSFFDKNIVPRVIKGKDRQQYVKKLLENNKNEQFIAENYINDKDIKIRLFLAEKINSKQYLTILVNDIDDQVRLAVIKRIRWADAEVSCSERLLDKSFDVRKEAFRIFKEGYNVIKQLILVGEDENIKENATNLSKKKTNLKKDARVYKNHIRLSYMFKKGSIFKFPENFINFNENIIISIQEDVKKFDVFMKKLFEGCLTMFKDEYLDILSQLDISLLYLVKNRDFKGLSQFIESTDKFNSYKTLHSKFNQEIDNLLDSNQNLNSVNSEFKLKNISESSENIKSVLLNECLEFGLKYLFNGKIDADDIFNLIDNEVIAVLNFIEQPEIDKFEKVLIDKCLASLKFNFVEGIANKLKDRLCFYDEFTGNYNLVNLYLINAHVKTSKMEIVDFSISKAIENRKENVMGSELVYSCIYYLIHRSKIDSNQNYQFIFYKLWEHIKSTNQTVKLLIYLNDFHVLQKFCDSLIGGSVSIELQESLLSKKTVVSTLIYFLLTGMVSVKSPSFFVKSIFICLKSTQLDKIKLLFAKYLRILDQSTFNIFYSICYSLRNTRLSSSLDDSIILNPRVDEDDKKLRMAKEDEILFDICTFIIGFRSGGEFIELNSDFSKFGFIKMTDEEIDLMSSGNVIYQ